MGRGRYNARDHEQDENGYEGRSKGRYTDDANVEDDYIYEDDDEYEVRPPRRRASETPYPPSHGTRRINARRSHNSRPPIREPRQHYPHKVQRKRSFWPALLGGCALGVFLVVLAAALIVIFALRNLQSGNPIANIPGMITLKPFSKDETQKLPLSQISQILVCDQVGNVTLRVDPTIDKPTLTTKKTVRAANQADANKALQQIIVEAQPPNTITHSLTCARSQVTPTAAANAPAIAITPTTTSPAPAPNAADNTTLTINVLFPNNDSFNHSVDLNIAFPPGVLSNANGPSIPVDVEAPIGDINVDGLSGLLNIRGGTGNVTVKHAILVDGSHIETAQGNVVFNGFLAAPLTENGKGAHYIIQSEHNVDVTLPGNTSVILDANTNVGKITSDFPITVTNENGAMNYNGPLDAASSIKPNSTLVVDVSTGNITIHRSQP